MYNAIVSYIRGKVPENIFLALSHKAAFSLDKNGDYEEEFRYLKIAFNSHVFTIGGCGSDYIMENTLVYEALKTLCNEVFNSENNICSLYFEVCGGQIPGKFKKSYYLFTYEDGFVNIYSDC